MAQETQLILEEQVNALKLEITHLKSDAELLSTTHKESCRAVEGVQEPIPPVPPKLN